MIARTQGDVQLPDWCKGVRLLCTKAIRQKGSGAQFPKRCPCGKRVPLLKLEPGRSFPTGPLGETATQNSGSKRDVVSQTDLLRKLHPGIRTQNWSPVSQTGLFRKLRPTLKDKTGMRFPGRASKTKLRWNSSCLGLQPAKTRTISPQLMRAGKMPALATKCHLRGLGGHSQRHVTETHIGYGMPSSTDKRCPAGLPSNEACHSLRRSARCRQSADTAK